MKRTLIQNAVVVNEGRKVLGSVVIENEKIAEILVGDTSCCRSTTFCGDICLMSQSGIAEMHMFVDGTRQKITPGCVYYLVAGGSCVFFTNQYFGYLFILDYY